MNLDQFAETLVRQVRDRAITNTAFNLDVRNRTVIARRWASVVPASLVDGLRDVVIPDVIDAVLFQLLNAIENDLLPVALEDDQGGWLRLSEVFGFEAAGEYIGDDDGWRQRYSDQPYNSFG